MKVLYKFCEELKPYENKLNLIMQERFEISDAIVSSKIERDDA